MSGGKRRHEYPTGRIDWEDLSPSMREHVYHEQAVGRILRRPTTEQRALRRAEARIANCEALSRRAARRKARAKAVRAARRAHR